MTPSIITSKVAQNHLDTIKMRHADILLGMQNQAQRVAQLKQQTANVDANKLQQDREDAFRQQELAVKSQPKYG